MAFALCVAKRENEVVLSNLRSTMGYGISKYVESLGGGRCSKWFVAEYKDREVMVYAGNIVSEVKDLSKVSLVLPIKGEDGYSDVYVIGPAFLCLAYKSKKGIGKGDLFNKDRGFSEWFSAHIKKLSIGKESAALFMPDLDGDYHPVEPMNLGKTY